MLAANGDAWRTLLPCDSCSDVGPGPATIGREALPTFGSSTEAAVEVNRRQFLFYGAASAGLAATGAMKTDVWTRDRPPRDYAKRFAKYEPTPEPDGDLAKVTWPAFVIAAGPEVRRLYEFQVVNGSLMRYMPCFCGCGAESGHHNNRDCYIRSVGADGSVVFDSMAPT